MHASDEASLNLAVVECLALLPEGTSPEQPWSDELLGVILRGLYAAGRQYLHSPAVHEVLSLCDQIREAVEKARGALPGGHPNELLAALMVVEDAVCALEGYAAVTPFAHVDEAYLAKYGLLQALQLGFDGAEAVAQVLGVRLRADRISGGKTVKVARNIVAGHPVRGTMLGQSWHHFHDRASAHDPSVIRIMSFSRRDPTDWTGNTFRTNELVNEGVRVIGELLRQALEHFVGRAAAD